MYYFYMYIHIKIWLSVSTLIQKVESIKTKIIKTKIIKTKIRNNTKIKTIKTTEQILIKRRL